LEIETILLSRARSSSVRFPSSRVGVASFLKVLSEHWEWRERVIRNI